MNLLHSIKALGSDFSVNVIIEVPIGSKSKIEYDKDKETFVVDRVLKTELTYPFNYGFVPETWSMDNDPLDAVVISSQPISTGNQIETRIVGMLTTTDQDGPDSKIIVVPVSENDPVISKIINIENVNEQMLGKIQYFYKNYKIAEPGKWVDIDGFFSKEQAETILAEAVKRYHQHFQK